MVGSAAKGLIPGAGAIQRVAFLEFYDTGGYKIYAINVNYLVLEGVKRVTTVQRFRGLRCNDD